MWTQVTPTVFDSARRPRSNPAVLLRAINLPARACTMPIVTHPIDLSPLNLSGTLRNQRGSTWSDVPSVKVRGTGLWVGSYRVGEGVT